MGKRNHRHIPKSKKIIQEIRQLSQPKEFRVEAQVYSDDGQLNEIMKWIDENRDKAHQTERPTVTNPQWKDILQLLAEIATGLWRTRQKMLIPGSEDQPREEMRRAYRPLDAAYQNLKQAGIEIVDQTHQAYIIGMTEKVIAFEPHQEMIRETIIETVKPTIYFHGQLMQQGEIIVGTPGAPAASQ